MPAGPEASFRSGYFLSAAFPSNLWVAFQNAVNFRGFEFDVQVVVHQHHGRAVACPQAHDWQQSKPAIAGGLTGSYAQLLRQMLELPFPVHDPATYAVTDMNDVPAHRLAEDQVIESGDAVQFGRGHVQESADILQGII